MRDLSSTTISEMNKEETAEAVIALITIDHEQLEQPIRVTSDNVETISNGETFLPFPFEYTLPSESKDRSALWQFKIDNVDRQIIQAIRMIDSAADVVLEIVLASEPDVIEARFPNMRFTNISYNALSVTGTVSGRDLTREPTPYTTFNPVDFPALH